MLVHMAWEEKSSCRDQRELLRNNLHTYLQYGGKLFTNPECRKVFCNLFLDGTCWIHWIPELLIYSSELWTVDELSPSEICLIGILARADSRLRDLLKNHLASCLSRFHSDRVSTTDRLYEYYFGANSILRHSNMLDKFSKRQLLEAVCRGGSVPMLQFSMDIGIDSAQSRWPYSVSHNSLLGVAAVGGNLDNVSFLTRAGLDSAIGLRYFLVAGKRVSSDSLYKCILQLFVENATLPTHYREDPLSTLLTFHGRKALSLYPEIVKTLVSRQIFHHELLFGGESQKPPVERSYMLKAIIMGYANIVDLFLANGVQANALVADFFTFEDDRFPSH